MKKKQGFTLIELLAVIVILAVIALIATPLIMGVIERAKKNVFRNTSYGILKAGENYVAETLLESENEYPGETISFPETGTKKLKYKGQDPLGGQMVISKKGNISLVIYNDSWCVTKNAKDKDVKIEKYDKNSCKLEVNFEDNSFSEIIISKNTEDNEDGLFTDDFGNIRYRGGNTEVKNYVTFNSETWRIIGIFDGKIKLIRNASIGNIAWDTKNRTNWDNSTLKPYLNETYYNSLSETAKSKIEESTFYLGGTPTGNSSDPKQLYLEERGSVVYSGNPTTTVQNIGLLYISDYRYSVKSNCNGDRTCLIEGNWLFLEGRDQWTQVPHSSLNYAAYSILETTVFGSNTFATEQVRPVLYLKATVKITGGDGTTSNPYILS